MIKWVIIGPLKVEYKWEFLKILPFIDTNPTWAPACFSNRILEEKRITWNNFGNRKLKNGIDQIEVTLIHKIPSLTCHPWNACIQGPSLCSIFSSEEFGSQQTETVHKPTGLSSQGTYALDLIRTEHGKNGLKFKCKCVMSHLKNVTISLPKAQAQPWVRKGVTTKHQHPS